MKKLLALSALLLSTTAVTAPALADHTTSHLGAFDKERFQVRVRAIGIIADGDGRESVTGLATDVDNAYTPEVDVTYFFSDHIAAELIAATAEHEIKAGANNIGNTMILPPTLTLQYHFMKNDEKFSPYVGAGVNYSHFYNEDDNGGFNGLDVDGGFGLALQAGADFWINENWGWNVDVKYIDVDVDVTSNLNGTALRASDVELNPWVIGTGISYRF